MEKDIPYILKQPNFNKKILKTFQLLKQYFIFIIYVFYLILATFINLKISPIV